MTTKQEQKKVFLCSVWNELYIEERSKAYMKSLQEFIKERRSKAKVYPEAKDTFRALHLTSYENIRVVILGQDPYHTEGVADGLAFSSGKYGYCPPSLQNILDEVLRNVNMIPGTSWSYDPFANKDRSFSLEKWASQEGVLLLNTILTVEKGQPKSHANKGWEKFTTAIIKKIAEHPLPIVFMLWGNDAKAYQDLLKDTHHCVLTAPHPAADQYNKSMITFKNCVHFYKAFNFLAAHRNQHKSVQFKNQLQSNPDRMPIRWMNL